MTLFIMWTFIQILNWPVLSTETWDESHIIETHGAPEYWRNARWAQKNRWCEAQNNVKVNIINMVKNKKMSRSNPGNQWSLFLIRVK